MFEVMLVVVILGILAVSALPIFFDISEESHDAAIEGVVGAVRDAIAIYRANDLAMNGSLGSYPATLDSNPANSPCASCFSEVLANGLSNSSWSKVSGSTYTANDGTGVVTFAYDSTNGTFSSQ